MRRYLISMGIRTLCVLLVFLIHNPARWVFAAGAVVLPYIAVLLANATDRRTPRPNSSAMDYRSVAADTAAPRGPVPPSRAAADSEVLTGVVVNPPVPPKP